MEQPADRRGRIVTTYAEAHRSTARAGCAGPLGVLDGLLRTSPVVDSATEDLEAFAEALAKATELRS